MEGEFVIPQPFLFLYFLMEEPNAEPPRLLGCVLGYVCSPYGLTGYSMRWKDWRHFPRLFGGIIDK
jgi:hypothetical protein